MHCLIFSAHATNSLKWHEMGPGGFFPTNPDLADILGDMDFDFENFYFLVFLDLKFPDFQFPDFQISRNLAWARAWARAWAGGRLGPGRGLGAPEFLRWAPSWILFSCSQNYRLIPT